MRCSLEGTVVGETHKWALNGCSSSSELGAQYMFNLTKDQRIPHLQEKDMPVASSAQCHVVMQESVEKMVCGCSEQLHLSRIEISRGVTVTQTAKSVR